MSPECDDNARPADRGSDSPRYFLVLPAAGSGQRMQSAVPKQYLEIGGKTLLQLTLERLGSVPWLSAIVVVLAGDDSAWPAVRERLSRTLRDRLLIAPGGAERSQSVTNALATLADRAAEDDWVLVHDAVRPCVHEDDLERLVTALRDEPAGGLLAVPVRETVKESVVRDGETYVRHTLDRSALWLAATPQMFRFGILRKALQLARERQLAITDEASAVELLGAPVRLVGGRQDNLKVTWPEDLVLVEAILRAQQQDRIIKDRIVTT